jgi:ectoine hydroxylase-related dioxygenase (phytanoyl-CoA dioxygenase family)
MVGRATTTKWNVIDDVTPLVSSTVRQPASVPAECIDAFAELGVGYLPGAFVDWVDPLREGLERMMRSPNDFAFPNESADEAEPGRFFDAYCNWQRVPEFLMYAMTSSAAAIAAQCMQSPTAQLFHEHVFAKEVGTEKKTPWHHDLSYYCVDGRQTASVYVALDDTDEETAVRFLGGSHRDGNTYTPRRFRSGVDYPQEDDSMVPAPADEKDSRYPVISRSLVAGDAIVFDFRTLHGTTDARINSRRRAFSTRWLGEDVRYIERPGITSPPLGDLGVRDGEPMPEHLFPTLWTTPR